MIATPISAQSGRMSFRQSMGPSSAMSVYQQSQQIINKFKCLPTIHPSLYAFVETLDVPASAATHTGSDPVSILWQAFKRGTLLCYLMNVYQPGSCGPIIEQADPEGSREARTACKKNIYQFMSTWNKVIHTQGNPAEELGFVISDLLGDDSSVIGKAIHAVEMLLDRIEEAGIADFEHIRRQSQAYDMQQSIGLNGESLTTRDKVVKEILDTERKYVRDLEIMQGYKGEALHKNIGGPELMMRIFNNIDILVDFQRRFLIRLEDALTAAKSREHQQIGTVFQELIEGETAYQNWAVNYRQACDEAIAHASELAPMNDYIEASRELPSYLIRPVQRICKYPLLIKELIKSTPKENQRELHELRLALTVSENITTKVNETNREVENDLTLQELPKRITDWKGLKLSDLGRLLQEAKVLVTMDDQNREMLVFLFETMLICCKEKKLSVRVSTSNGALNDQKKSALSIKGRILISQISNSVMYTHGNTFTLKIFWADGEGLESFTLKFLSEEMLRKWKDTLDRALQDLVTRGLHSSPHSAAAVPQIRKSLSQTFGRLTKSALFDDASAPGSRSISRVNSSDMLRASHDELAERGRSNSTQGSSSSLFARRKVEATSPLPFHAQPDSPESALVAAGLVSPEMLGSKLGIKGRSNQPPPVQRPPYPAEMERTAPRIERSRSRDQLASSKEAFPSSEVPSSSAGSELAERLQARRRQVSQSTRENPMTTSPPTRPAAPYPDASNKGAPPLAISTAQAQLIAPLLAQADISKSPSSEALIGLDKLKISGKPIPAFAPNDATTTRPVAPPPPLPRSSSHTSLSSSSEQQIKVKVHYEQEKYLMIISRTASYAHLLAKIVTKLHLPPALSVPTGAVNDLKLKFQDEDGDWITMRGDDDVEMAIGSVGTSDPAPLNIYVT